MRKLGLVLSILAVFATLLLFAQVRPAQGAALNESDSAEEADFCTIWGAPPPLMAAGGSLQVLGRIFESGITESAGENPDISADVGVGPSGSDPRVDGGWTYFPAVFNTDVGNDDEYVSTATMPSPTTTTTYAFVYRFSLDGGTDHTYCDTDGAGSNPGLDYDPGLNGVVTVEGTGGGGGGGGSEGSVDTSVDVISDPGACILLDTNAVSFGQETFSTQNAAQLGLAQMTVTSCSLTTSLDLLAKGTNATGPTAAWALTDPPGSGNMCGTGGGGIDEYGQRVQTNDGQQGTELALTNRTYMTGLAQGVSQPTDILLRMPCIGSSGTGETVSSTIMFTAIPGAPPPPPLNVCIDPFPFLDTGTSAADNTACQTGEGELVASCVNPPTAGHNQYFAFELQDGETGTVVVDAPWDAVVALYNVVGPVEVDCSDYLVSGPQTVSGQNNSGEPAFYAVQIDGVTPNDFGEYLITLSIGPAGGVDADGDGFTVAGGDCDDASASVHPGATEILNGIDDNCDGLADEGLLTDNDGDTFFAPFDCDDTNAAVHPGAAEVLNGIDDDCNGVVDDGQIDADLDSFTVADGDCNDADASVYPGALELLNGVDDDCNGVVDDGGLDFDGDGWTPAEGDCNDVDVTIHPGAADPPDGIDNDCDGVIDG